MDTGLGFQISSRLDSCWWEWPNFPLPCLIIFRVYLYPSTYFPLFITSWSLELINSSNFFFFFAATIFLPFRCRWLITESSHQDGQGARKKGVPTVPLFSGTWLLLPCPSKKQAKQNPCLCDTSLEYEILRFYLSNQTSRNVQFEVENYRKIRDEIIM